MEKKLEGLEKHVHRIFFAGAVLGAISCLGRADYNLPLYAFLFLMWDDENVSVPTHLIFHHCHINSLE
jgi:hypothetical protein